MAAKVASRPAVWPFALWAVAGAGLCLALLTVLTIGVFVLPVTAAALLGLIGWRGSRNYTAAGLLAGAGVIPLYVACLNRGGPGTVCTTTAAGQDCLGEYSPWPWLTAGVLLVAAGTGLCWWLRRQASRPG